MSKLTKYYIILVTLNVLILFGTFYLNNHLHSINGAHYKNSLQTLTSTTLRSIEKSYEFYKSQANYYANSKTISTIIKRLNSNEKNFKKLKQINQVVFSYLDPVRSSLQLEGYFIISKSGINLASTRNVNLGKKSVVLQDEQSWQKALNGKSVLTRLMPSEVPLYDLESKLTPGRATVFLLSPIIDSKEKITAILAFRINPHALMWEILKMARTGTSGESYAIDRKGNLLSHSRFQDTLLSKQLITGKNKEILAIKVKTPAGDLTKMAQSLQNQEEAYNILGYQDYRGTNVIGYWIWSEKLNLGITSEIDYEEAYEFPERFGKYIWGITFLLILMITSLFILLKTRLTKSEDQVDQQQRFLKETMDIMPAVFYAKNTDGLYITVNKFYKDIFQLNEKEIVNKTDYDLFPKNIADQFRKNDQDVISNGKLIESEEVALDSSGQQRTYHSFKFPYHDKDGDVWAIGGFSLDITEKKRLEQESNEDQIRAIHTARLASIGELSGQIAHEMNTPLTAITLAASSLLKRIEKEEFSKELYKNQLNLVLKVCKKLAKIISSVRKLSSGANEEELSKVNLSSIIEDTMLLCENSFHRNNIEFTLNLETDEEQTINCSPSEISQVIMNLINNAIDAAKEIDDPQKWVKLNISKIDNYICFKLSDSGKGISEKIRNKIFDPRFTTKSLSDGTGLGLALSSQIIKRHGGEIYLVSDVKNTTFIFNIPDV
ncbi:MAG: PAS domain-containing protein [Bdellovibrionaceae bacterium]|nr:PAS domain-containing protein [Pseudobdellovibrionaceae bacterium]